MGWPPATACMTEAGSSTWRMPRAWPSSWASTSTRSRLVVELEDRDGAPVVLALVELARLPVERVEGGHALIVGLGDGVALLGQPIHRGGQLAAGPRDPTRSAAGASRPDERARPRARRASRGGAAARVPLLHPGVEAPAHAPIFGLRVLEVTDPALVGAAPLLVESTQRTRGTRASRSCEPRSRVPGLGALLALVEDELDGERAVGGIGEERRGPARAPTPLRRRRASRTSSG